MRDSIVTKMEVMGERLDELEQSIDELIGESGLDESKITNKDEALKMDE